MLFLFYEIFGVITNLVGGWLGAKIGLNATMNWGLALQVIALSMLLVPGEYLSVAWVMSAQALSGIAKDLNKMSAKSADPDAGSPRGRRDALQMDRHPDGLQECAEGRGFLSGRGFTRGMGFQGSDSSHGCRAGSCLVMQHNYLAAGSGKVQRQTEVQPPVFQEPGRQLPVRCALIPVRCARCLVCGRTAGLSLLYWAGTIGLWGPFWPVGSSATALCSLSRQNLPEAGAPACRTAR